MRDETQYHQYASWKVSNEEFLKKLQNTDSGIYFRFAHILTVTDFLYDKLIDDPNYSDDEDIIFITGVNYLSSLIYDLTMILKEIYQDDFEKFLNDEKKITLVMDIIEFQNELLRYENVESTDMNYFIDLEKQILDNIKNNKEIPDSIYQELDNKSVLIFKKYTDDFLPITTIFLEIAAELKLDI